MFRFLDAFRQSEEWDQLAPSDPHFASAYYRAWGGGTLVEYTHPELKGRIIQPFRNQDPGWIGNAYNFGGLIITDGSYDLPRCFSSDWQEWKQKIGVNERCTVSPFGGAVRPPSVNYTMKDIVVVDLSMIKLRATTRHCVQKAVKHDAQLHFFDYTDNQHIEMFEDMYDASMRRKSALAHWRYPPGFFARVLTGLGPQRCGLVMTTLGGIVESGAIYIMDENVLYYHWAATYGTRPADGANHFQVKGLIDWAQAGGKKYVCLGGGLTAERGDPLFGFKAGFSRIFRPVFSYTTTVEK